MDICIRKPSKGQFLANCVQFRRIIGDLGREREELYMENNCIAAEAKMEEQRQAIGKFRAYQELFDPFSPRPGLSLGGQA